MGKEEFYRKNDIGVNILYTVIGYYNDNGRRYCIYTDFVSSNNKAGIRLFVDGDSNGKMVRLQPDEEKKIIIKFNKDILKDRDKIIGW